MSDFSTSQGPIDSGVSTERSPKESGTPKTGFDQAPAGERPTGGPGPGIGANGRGWK